MLDISRLHKKYLIFLAATKTFTMKDCKNKCQEKIVRRGRGSDDVGSDDCKIATISPPEYREDRVPRL